LDAGSSVPKGAVFLSYASQDAEAAKRIADALRAAGVEVWFDQNELVGGDAWDQKIRKQIGSCALFMPIISASTQARAEGYFRLEWRLADKRTELMGRSKAFLLPVCIDDTRDGDADVPDSFLAVQWTRLRGGETTPAFVARVARLLDGNESPRRSESRVEGSVAPIAPKPSLAKSWLRWEAMVAIMVLGAGGLAYWWQSGRGAPASAQPPATAPAAAPPKETVQPNPPTGPVLSPARALVAKAAELHENLDAATRADFELAGDMFKQALALAPLDAEVWAHYSWYCNNVYGMGVDRSPERDVETKRAADKAMKLDPQSAMARFAWANYYRRQPASSGEAIRVLREITRMDTPYKGPMLRVLALALGRSGASAEEAMTFLDQAIALPGGDAHAWALKGDFYWSLLRPAEADDAYSRSLAIKMTPRVLTRKALFLVFQHGDLEGAEKLLAQLPAEFLQEDRAVGLSTQLALWQRKPEVSLGILARFPRDYIADSSYGNVTGPTGLFAGYARWLQGKPDLARLEWEGALRVVDQRLASRRTDPNLNSQRMELLALLGRRDEAQAAMRLVEQLQPWRRDPSQSLIDTWSGKLDAVFTRLKGVNVNQDSRLELRYDPKWEPLRRDSRYEALLAPPASAGTAVQQGKSIAVLPFTNMSEDRDANAFFADGIHEDILTNLAGIRELRVVSRTSVMDYRGTTKKIPQIGQELNVAYVLEGSVRRAGNKVRVTGQLIRTATDEHVWAKSFDRDLTDIFQIQAELAKAIAGELNAAISPQEQTQLTARPTENLAAYDLFLKSREIANRGAASNREDLQKRERLLQSAVELDPKFLDAWCELVQAHVGLIAGSVDTTPARLAKAATALDRAKALAPDAPEVARAVGAYQLFGLREPGRAVEQFARLVELHPNDTESLNWLGTAQMLAGRWAESLATQRRLTQLDPANRTFGMNLAMTLRLVRRYDESLAELRRLLASRPDDPGVLRALGYVSFLATGSIEVAEQSLKRLETVDPDGADAVNLRQTRALRNRDYAEYFRLDQAHPGGLNRGSFDSTVITALEAARIYCAIGDMDGARKRLGNLPATLRAQLELEPNNTQYLRSIAMAESILGNHAEAIRWIDRAAEVMPEAKESRIGLTISVLRARILAWAGEKDRAIAEITRLFQVPSELNVHQMKGSIGWAPLLDDPRFQALMADPKNNAPLY
jgi:TolB-like protein/Flp pilus assembly protein TadD